MKTLTSAATRLLRFNSGGGTTSIIAPPAPPAFDPVSLPFSVVFEARTGRRLNAAGGPASLPGDPVGVWQSRASGGLEAAQATFAARPVYQTVGGKPVLRFSADDFLTVSLAASVPGFGDTITVAICVEPVVAGAFQMVACIGSNAAPGSWFLALDSVGRVGMGAYGAGFFVITSAALTGSGPHTIIVRKNGAYASLRVNGQELGVVTPGTTLTALRGPLTIGASPDYAINLNGDVRFFAAAPAACLSNADCAAIEAYCASL